MAGRVAPSSPFDVESVFKKILEYVATDHNSILACRLITPTWNELALKVLRQKGTTVALWKAAPHLVKYVQIDTRTNEATLVNQDLTLWMDTNPRGSAGQLESATRRLDLKLRGETSYDPSDLLLQIPRAIQMGYRILITSINYCRDPDSWSDGRDFVPFVLLLELCALNLKQLTYIEGWSDRGRGVNFTCIWQRRRRAANRVVERVRSICFQKLATIHIIAFLAQHTELHPVVMCVVNNSPNLRTFNLQDVSIGADGGRIWTDELLMITNQLSATQASIQDLAITTPHMDPYYPAYGEIDPAEFFDSIQMPNLKILTLNVEVQLLGNSRHIEASFHELLCALPSLKSLTCNWICGSYIDSEEIEPRFPALPQLAHFGTSGILDVYVDKTIFVKLFLRKVGQQCSNVKEFSFDQNSLYAISSKVVFDDIDDMLIDDGVLSWRNGILFPEVKSLELKGYLNLCSPCYDTDGEPESLVLKNFLNEHHLEDIEDFEERDETVQGLLFVVPKLMFPNLHKIVVDNGSSFYTKEDLALSEKYLLPEILKVEGIRCLEIRTYYNHWLVKPIMDLSVLSESLQILILRLPKEQDMMFEPETIEVQELSTLLGQLPQLQTFEISAKLLRASQDGGTKFEDIFQEILQLRNLFLNIDIKVL